MSNKSTRFYLNYKKMLKIKLLFNVALKQQQNQRKKALCFYNCIKKKC